MKRASVMRLMLIFIWFIPLLGCATTFKGRVIDYESKEPIEGAVVVAHWLYSSPSIFGENTWLKDVKETLTDKNGEWSMVGDKGSEGSAIPCLYFGIAGTRYTRKPEFIIFKPGYCSWDKGYSIEACKGKMQFIGSGEIMEGKTLLLPKLTEREDRLRASAIGPIYGNDDREKEFLKKQREFIRLLNHEHKSLGLQEYKFEE